MDIVWDVVNVVVGIVEVVKVVALVLVGIDAVEVAKLTVVVVRLEVVGGVGDREVDVVVTGFCDGQLMLMSVAGIFNPSCKVNPI